MPHLHSDNSSEDALHLLAIDRRCRSDLSCHPGSETIRKLTYLLERPATNQMMCETRCKRVAGSDRIHNVDRESSMLNRLIFGYEHTSAGPARDANQPQAASRKQPFGAFFVTTGFQSRQRRNAGQFLIRELDDIGVSERPL